jgi:N-methylhydantoinase A/oxoprolinase/acetone carboxylase beta subunit
VVEKQEPYNATSITSGVDLATKRLEVLQNDARNELISQGFHPSSITCTGYLNLRYQGTDTAIMTHLEGNSTDFGELFLFNYKREYGFELLGRDILIDDIRVRAIGMYLCIYISMYLSINLFIYQSIYYSNYLFFYIINLLYIFVCMYVCMYLYQ